MSRHHRTYLVSLLCGAILSSGCQPVQPFFFMEDGDLSHYVGVATEIEYPDVADCGPSPGVNGMEPLTLRNFNSGNYTPWDLSLQEVTRIALNHSEVIRQLGSVTIGQIVGQEPETFSRTLASPVSVPTTFDPAISETGTGTSTGIAVGSSEGVEAALSAFDARLDSSVFWNKNRTPQNRNDVGIAGGFSPSVLGQELGTFTTGITKVTAPGTQFSIRNNTRYEGNNIPAGVGNFNAFPSVWETNFEAAFSHPLLQGRGTEYNRIAGPFSFNQYAANQSNPIDGVVIARINTDLTLADFESGIRNMLCDLEEAYWEVYFAYRDLQARKMGQDSAQETWKNVHAKYQIGAADGSADREAQARSQLYQFVAQVEEAATRLLQSEANLRYMMGIPHSDGRLIRPSDKPTTAGVNFDWAEIHAEALVRRVEVRKQKWLIKKRELELVAARNNLLPRLDAVGTYRWRGMGDQLLGSGGGIDSNANGITHNEIGSNAFDELMQGNYQEWQLGLQLSVPIGYRRQMAQARQHELLLARERALLRTLEAEMSSQLAAAVRSLDFYYIQSQTLFKRRVAAEQEVQTVQEIYEAGRTSLDQLLDAQRRRAEAESAYYQALVNYNTLIMQVHRRKGSALDYNGVYLAEGPWPGKAQFDALRRARQRDASMYLDYGFTQPQEFSRGAYQNGNTDFYGGPDTGYEVIESELVRPGELSIPGEYLPLEPATTDSPSPNIPTLQLDQSIQFDSREAAPGVAGQQQAITHVLFAPTTHESTTIEGPSATGLDASPTVMQATYWQTAQPNVALPIAPGTEKSSTESSTTLPPLTPAAYERHSDNTLGQTATIAHGWASTQRGEFIPGVRGESSNDLPGSGITQLGGSAGPVR